ncbi:MAG: hypothetical protein RIR00_2687 [Pseudomonadota bacterium]
MPSSLSPPRPRVVRFSAPVSAVLLSLLLGGCGVLQLGPDYSAPVLNLPARWQAWWSPAPEAAGRPLPDAAALAGWWRQWPDPLLAELIEAALAANLDLQQAVARLRQARAARNQSASALYPSLSASLGATRSRNAGTLGAPVASHTLYDAGFDASWELDVFGGNRRALEAAEADLASREALLGQSRVSLIAEVALNYVDLRQYQRRLEIGRDNLQSQDETLQLTAWRQQAGLARSSDVEQARSNREQTRASLPDLQLAAQAAANRLAVLLGQPPGSLQTRLQTYRPLPALPAAFASGIPADLLRQRPDLVAAERTLAAETARIGQKQAQRFPALNLSAALGWQAYSASLLGDAASRNHALGGSLASSLFDAGRLKNAVAAQDAVAEQARLAYEQSVLTALEEVENALYSHALARERLDARRAAAVAAGNAALLSRQLYESGLTDFQRLLDSERSRLSNEDSQAIAEATLVSSLIKLYKALGGGWDNNASPTATPLAAAESTAP